MRTLLVLACLTAACELPTANTDDPLPASGKADSPTSIKAVGTAYENQLSAPFPCDGKNPSEIQFLGFAGDAVEITVHASGPAQVGLHEENGFTWFKATGKDSVLDVTLTHGGYSHVYYRSLDGKAATFTVFVQGPVHAPAPPCTPKRSCPSGKCGWINDGCGQLFYCDSCTSGQVCGGDGIANQCGSALPAEFSPGSNCNGPQLTNSEALRMIGSYTARDIGGYVLSETHRDCTTSGCGPWSTAADELRGGIRLSKVGSKGAKLDLSTDYCGSEQVYAPCTGLGTSTMPSNGLSCKMERVVDESTCATALSPTALFTGVVTSSCLWVEAHETVNGRETYWVVNGFYF